MTDKPPLSQVLEALANKKVPCQKCEGRKYIVGECDCINEEHLGGHHRGCPDCNGTNEILDPMFALLRMKCDHGSHVPPHDDFHNVSVRTCRWCAHIRDCPGWTTADESQAADAMGRILMEWPAHIFRDIQADMWHARKWYQLTDITYIGTGSTPWDALYRACAQAAEVGM